MTLRRQAGVNKQLISPKFSSGKTISRKIVILNESPRKHGNAFSLTASFRKGAEEGGFHVSEFHLSGMNIHGSMGCRGGKKDPLHPGTRRDDMGKIDCVYQEADIVLLASPLYYWFISGFLKNVFDRLFAIAECDPDDQNPNKENILVMAVE